MDRLNTGTGNQQEGEGDEGEVYAYKQLEDDMIKYICEKIVAMRE